MIDPHHRALLTLALTHGMGRTTIARALEKLGPPEAVVEADAGALAQAVGASQARARKLRTAIDQVCQEGLLAREIAQVQAVGARLLALDDADYPEPLRSIPDPPLLLYVRGEIQSDDRAALAIVGSRRCSRYGREQAERFAALGAQAGLCIVSGGAYGVDAAAHRATLRAGGRTLAVLGSGLAEPYPADHGELFDAIADGRGAVVSEFPMTAPVRRENFPRRNRVISGLSRGVLVVEAAKRSGALITAKAAAEQGRPVLAVPGDLDRPGSHGPNDLIRQGQAVLVAKFEHVLEALETKARRRVSEDAEPAAEELSLFTQQLSEPQRLLVEAMDRPRAVDELCATTGLAAATIQAELTMLQIRGVIERSAGRYARKR